MKVLIRLLKNDFTRIFRINQMRYGNPSQRSKAISLYILIFAVVIGIIIYWMNSLHTVFSYAWTIEEVIAYFFGPMLKVSVVLNLFIGIFGAADFFYLTKMLKQSSRCQFQCYTFHFLNSLFSIFSNCFLTASCCSRWCICTV